MLGNDESNKLRKERPGRHPTHCQVIHQIHRKLRVPATEATEMGIVQSHSCKKTSVALKLVV